MKNLKVGLVLGFVFGTMVSITAYEFAGGGAPWFQLVSSFVLAGVIIYELIRVGRIEGRRRQERVQAGPHRKM